MTPLRVLVLSALGMMSVGASVYTLTPPRREPLSVTSLQEPLAFALELELSTELPDALSDFPAEIDGGLDASVPDAGPSRVVASRPSPVPSIQVQRTSVTIDPGSSAGPATRRYLCAFPSPDRWFILSDESSDVSIRAMPLAQQILVAERLPACTCADRCESACRMSRDASAECRLRCRCTP
ncbi:hypothetical protein [Polyangium sorediatum]|uniref:Secreted protein n=1 Tax=Polyangium sorediatum TaxID=889274 RepID=A0ABT6P910_9BACT|nr:hypothetical protein [Polyangium sorediatum]MDI1437098.1 hypothetical protein [Polyangium sorediatum]